MDKIYRVLLVVRPPIGVVLDVPIAALEENSWLPEDKKHEISGRAMDTFFKKYTTNYTGDAGADCEIEGFGGKFISHIDIDDLDVAGIEVSDVTAEYLEKALTTARAQIVELKTVIENLSRK